MSPKEEEDLRGAQVAASSAAAVAKYHATKRELIRLVYAVASLGTRNGLGGAGELGALYRALH